MVVEGQVDRVNLDNGHEQRFTISNVDTTSRVLKYALAVHDADGNFDPTTPVLSLSSADVAAQFTREVEGPTNSTILVTLLEANLDSTVLSAGDHEFQFEVFDAAGANGKVVASGTITLVPNIVETS